MSLDAYRRRAEEFLAELTDAFRIHYAGLSADYRADAIYARYEDLFTAEAVATVRDARAEAATSDPDAPRRLRMLLDFAIDGLIGYATRDLETELARREAALTITCAGRTLGFREGASAQANEPDAARRGEIEQARLDATEIHLNPLYRESLQLVQGLAVDLGFESYAALCGELKGLDLAGLGRQTSAFIERTAEPYPSVLSPELEATVGLGASDWRRADLPRFLRAADLDRWFPPGRLAPTLTETLARGGIDLRSQTGVMLDIDARPTKSPRAFCAPVRIPGEVHLVIAPIGGRDDYTGLMHEGGHTEHYAHVRHELAFEFRCLGDNAITECHAFLLMHLVDDPEWLRRRLGVPEDVALAIAARGRAERLLFLRRYSGKLGYELELHGAAAASDGAAMRSLYAERLGSALGIPWPQEPYLADVDGGFYVACYLRAWALETHLRSHLRAAFGTAWFEQPDAWAELQALWREGQRMTPDELLGQLGEEPRLDFGVLADDLGV